MSVAKSTRTIVDYLLQHHSVDGDEKNITGGVKVKKVRRRHGIIRDFIRPLQEHEDVWKDEEEEVGEAPMSVEEYNARIEKLENDIRELREGLKQLKEMEKKYMERIDEIVEKARASMKK